MGLDMYAYSVPKKYANGDFGIAGDDSNRIEIAYWRKFNALHGWMQKLYESKGGDMGNMFNCDYLRLYPEDISKLQQDILQRNLTPTDGFFFGALKLDEHDLESALVFCGKALAELYRGRAVYYTSSW